MVVDDAPEVQVYRPISGERIADLVRNFVAHSIELRKKSVAKYRNALQSFDKWTKHKHDSLIRANDYCAYLVQRIQSPSRTDQGLRTPLSAGKPI